MLNQTTRNCRQTHAFPGEIPHNHSKDEISIDDAPAANHERSSNPIFAAKAVAAAM